MYVHASSCLNLIFCASQPSWTMYIQVMTFEEAEKFRWNPFDLTKVQQFNHVSLLL